MPGPLTVDKNTGYLESNALFTFNADKKKQFIQVLYDNPHYGGIVKTCKDLGISETTFWKHYQADASFRRDVEDLKRVHAHRVEQVLADRALDPKGTIDRIFYLKSNWPEKYDRATAPPTAVQVNISIGDLKEAMQRISVVDTQAVPTIPHTENTQHIDNTMQTTTEHALD